MDNNQNEIEEVLNQVIEEINYWKTEDGKFQIKDKGKTKESILTDVIADVLEIARKRGFDYEHIWLHGALRFMFWNTTPFGEPYIKLNKTITYGLYEMNQKP